MDVINRSGEGTEVVEDYVPMVIQDEHLSRQLQQLRQELAEFVASNRTSVANRGP